MLKGKTRCDEAFKEANTKPNVILFESILNIGLFSYTCQRTNWDFMISNDQSFGSYCEGKEFFDTKYWRVTCAIKFKSTRGKINPWLIDWKRTRRKISLIQSKFQSHSFFLFQK